MSANKQSGSAGLFRGTGLVFRRDFLGLFRVPTGWIVLVAGGLLSALFFSTNVVASGQAAFSEWAGNLAMTCFLTAPLLGMRAIAAEKSQGTLELLLTSPVSVRSIVWGKFLAIFVLQPLLLLLSSVPAFWALVRSGGEPALLLLPLLGVLLASALASGLSLAASALSSHPVSAAFLGLGLCLGLYFAGAAAANVDGPLGLVLRELTLQSHLDGFLRGLFDLKDVIYFLLGTLASVWVAERSLLSRAWTAR